MVDDHLRVLLVDDEEGLRVNLSKFLRNNFGYQVEAVPHAAAAWEQLTLTQGAYDVALIDDMLIPGPDGIHLMEDIRKQYADIECIILTGWGTEHRQRALQAGAFRYLEKPFNYDELAMLIRTAAQQVRLRIIGRAILAEHDQAKLLTQIGLDARSLALADEAEISLLDRTTQSLKVYAHTAPADRSRPIAFELHTVTREIVQTGRAVAVPDLEQDESADPAWLEAGLRSFFGVPIPGRSGNLGVLIVYSRTASYFKSAGTTISVLQTLAGQAGLAMANAESFQQINQHAAYMEALVKAGQGLTRTVQMDKQLQLAWDFVREQLHIDTFLVALLDRAANVLHFPLVYDKGERMSLPDRPLTADQSLGITGYVIQAGTELHWPTADDRQRGCDTLGIESIAAGEPCQSCFYLPLKIGADVIGALSIQSYKRHAFTPIQLDACRALGSQLSVALENARLFEAEAYRRREADQLRAASLVLTSTLRPDQVLDSILTELGKVVPYDSASVQLLKVNRLEIYAGHGFPNPAEIIGLTFSLNDKHPNRGVIEDRQCLIIGDVQPRYSVFSQTPHQSAGIQRWLGAPMLVGEQLIGMLALDKREPDFYTDIHAQLTRAFAAQAAIAIDNAQLYQGAQQRALRLDVLQELALLLNSSLALSDTLREVCKAAVRFFEADHSGLMVMLPDATYGVVQAEYPALGTLGRSIPLKGVIAEENLIQSRTPVLINAVATDTTLGPVRDILLEFNIRSILFVPVVSHTGRLLGSFSLDLIERTRAFAPDDHELVKVFSAHVAAAIDNAQLYEDTHRHEHLLAALDQASRHIRAEKETSKLLHEVVRLATELVGGDAGCLLINQP
ncbi:MAG: GAF domain-containing protein, partial [Chloroflexi bacterium]|nr:GAF domain-containing protein [Chloroflexota bacterium]